MSITPEQMDEMPEGSMVYDRDGDRLTKYNGYWAYNPGKVRGVCVPTAFGPYTLVPPVDPADPDYDPKRHARR